MRVIFLLFFFLYGLWTLFRSIGLPYVMDLIVTLPISLAIVSYFIWEPFKNSERRQRWSLIDLRSSKTMILGILLGLNFILLSAAFFRVMVLSMQYLWILSISMFLYAVFRWYFERDALDQFLQDLTISVVIMVGMNAACYLFGFENPAEAENYHRDFDALFNLLNARFYFPFTTSTRILSIFSGTGFLLALFTPFRWKSKTAVVMFRVFGSIVCLFVLVAAGARMPFLVFVVCALLGLFWDRIGRMGVYIGTAAAVLLPGIVLGSAQLQTWLQARADLPSIVDRIFTALTISNRHIIWAGAFTGAFRNLSAALFGHGIFGHLTSGASRLYAYLFEVSWTRPTMMPAHNSYIQILLDGGLMGLLSFLALIGVLLWKLPVVAESLTAHFSNSQAGEHVERSLSIPLLYLFMTASTEVSLSYIAPELLYLLIAFLFLLILGPGTRTLMQTGEDDSDRVISPG
ncbi:MAG: O-antigen ligase family protein [Anaerolineales bacterium]|nr:O-antigen ligase family protein [Anaerolineales bacterium]